MSKFEFRKQTSTKRLQETIKKRGKKETKKKTEKKEIFKKKEKKQTDKKRERKEAKHRWHYVSNPPIPNVKTYPENIPSSRK